MPSWPWNREVKSPGPGDREEPVKIRPSVKSSQQQGKDARNANIDAHAERLQYLYGEKLRLIDELALAEEEYRQVLDSQNATGTANRSDLSRRVVAARIELQRRNEMLDAAQPDVLVAQRELAEAQQKLEQVTNALFTAEQEEYTCKGQLDQTQFDLDTKRRELKDAEFQVSFASNRIADLEVERDTSQVELEAAIRDSDKVEETRHRGILRRVSSNMPKHANDGRRFQNRANTLKQQIHADENREQGLSARYSNAQANAGRLNLALPTAESEVRRIERELQIAQQAVQSIVDPIQQAVEDQRKEIKDIENSLSVLELRNVRTLNLDTLRKRKVDLESQQSIVNVEITTLESYVSRHFPIQFGHLRR